MDIKCVFFAINLETGLHDILIFIFQNKFSLKGAKKRIPNTGDVPVGLLKMKETGLWNAILEVDLGDGVYDFSKFPMKDLCALVKKWIVWVYKNLNQDAKVLINLRDMTDVMPKKPIRAFQLVKFLAEMPEKVRPFGLIFEEAKGTCLPEECGSWAKYIRKVMDAHSWNGKLLVHIHEKYGYADSSQLEVSSMLSFPVKLIGLH